MGTDYAARKQAKKANKRAAAEQNVNKRKRAKRGVKTRRLCQGMCYKTPVLSTEDKTWKDNSDDSDVDSETVEHQAQDAAADENGMLDGPAEPTAAGGRASKPKMSTAVDLLAPGKQQKQAGGQGRAAKRRKMTHAAQEPAPVSTALAAYPQMLQRYMTGEGFAQPTSVQTQCWPPCLEGRDVCAVAEPGSGKTLGYLLPLLARLPQRPKSNADNGGGATGGSGGESTGADGGDSNTRSSGEASGSGGVALLDASGPQALVLVPTRELAQQIATVARSLRRCLPLRAACLYGGVDKEEQLDVLARRPHLLVATPGRLLDLLDDEAVSLGSVSYVVLDEADKMLSMGFEPQLARLRRRLLPRAAEAGQGLGVKAASSRPRPQVLLFTATMPEVLAKASAKWQQDPVSIQVGASAASISRTVTQVVQVCAEHKKPKKLLKHLEGVYAAASGQRNPPRAIVFTNRVKTVRFLAKELQAAGYKVAMLHGQRSQAEREEAMRDFRASKSTVLVATDVAARGLHIRGLPYVVNYDLPSSLEQYIHRVGRTGRLAADGHAFSFFTRNLAPLAQPMLDLLQAHGQAVDPNLVRLAEAYRVAAEQLGGAVPTAAASDDDNEVDDAGEGDAEADEAEPQSVAEDLHEGLGLQSRLSRQRPKGGPSSAAAGGSASSLDPDRVEKGMDAAAPTPGLQAQQQGGAKRKRRQGVLETLNPDGGIVVADAGTDRRPIGAEAQGVCVTTADAAAALQKRKRTMQLRGGGARAAEVNGVAGKMKQKMKQRSEEDEAAGSGGVLALPSSSGRGGRRSGEQQGGAEAAGQLQFLPAKRFSGAKPGMVFQNGPQGVGYYPDGKPQQQCVSSTPAPQQIGDNHGKGAATGQRQQHQQGKRAKAVPGRLRKKLAKQGKRAMQTS